MFSVYHNLTRIFLLQNAISTILDQMGMEIDAHTVCVITNWETTNRTYDRISNDQAAITSIYLSDFPTISINCQMVDNEFTVFLKQVQQGVTLGCSFFVVSVDCALPFMDNFRQIHDLVDNKFEKKVLVVIDAKNVLTYLDILNILRHETVIYDLPLTQLLQPNIDGEWIDNWSAYPYSSYFQIYNRFFLSNFSFLYEKCKIPKVTDLNGLPVYGAFIHYPPYAAYYRVSPGTGNANLYNSNESLSVRLDGQEHLILVELCIKYNCTLTARLEYDGELWGEIYQNWTGTGLLGALAMHHANVTCGSLCLWDDLYEFTQYTSQTQRATITHILPKPLPLPFWETPILPFPGYIWGCIIGSLLISAVTLFIVNNIQTNIINKEQDESIENSEDAANGLFDSIFAVFMITIFQGVDINIKYYSTITIFTVILTFALVIGNLYCGGLSSTMTVTQYEEPIDSLNKLLKSNLIWGTTSYAWIFSIQQSDYPPHQQFIEKFAVKTIPEMLKLTQQRKMAVTIEIMQSGTLSYQPYIDKDTSKNYMIMRESMYWQATIMMTSKTWPFMEQLNRIVLMQQESGIRYYWERGSGVRTMDYDIQSNIEENGKPPQSGDPVKLSVDHILGAIFLLLFGYACAMVVFFLELVWYYYKK